MDDELERIIEELIDLLVDEYYQNRKSELVWEALWLEGNYKLIETLRLAETGQLGTVIIPDEGFSPNIRIHSLVMDWLYANRINTLNVSFEIRQLEQACTWRLQMVPLFRRHF
jgi:hypothetical protein